MLELFVIFEVLTIVSIWILVRLYADLKIEYDEELKKYKKALTINEVYFDELKQLNKDVLSDWGQTLAFNTELIEQNKFLINAIKEGDFRFYEEEK